jgi:LysM repeat protein
MGTTQIANAAVSHPLKQNLVIAKPVLVKPVATKAATDMPQFYQVRKDDSLSAISARIYGTSSYWTSIYWANSKTIAYANLINVGQELILPTIPRVMSVPRAMSPAAPRPVTTNLVSVSVSSSPQHVAHTTYQCGDGDGDGFDIPCSQLHHTAALARTVPTPAPAPAAAPSSSYGVGSSFQACVIARESGGNSQVFNASGHYGLYQFSASTWSAYGGNAADFGHASAAEQTRVFNNAMATAGGASNWAPYDGC